MSKAHKKPTGDLNVYKISSQAVDEIKTNFPATKEEQEVAIVALFLQLVNKDGERLPFGNYIKNPEQDIDFTITNKSGNTLLELTELVPADKMKGGYAGVSHNVHQGELVERLIKIIEDKSSSYQGIKTPIGLLVYVTDDNSNISIDGEKYLKTYLNLNPHAFRAIFYFVPMLGLNDGIIIQYFPNNEKSKMLPPFPGIAINLKPNRNIPVGQIGSNRTPPKKKRKKR